MTERESYDEFLNRIFSYEHKTLDLGSGYFKANDAVNEKVDENNRFKRFYGDTVVFDLDDITKARIATLENELYEKAPESFAERLVCGTFHMTLHDLSASTDINNVAPLCFENEIKLLEILKANPASNRVIRMKTRCIFNILNISLALALYPADESEFEKLMQLYYLVDEVRELDYKLTPHITLAYFSRYVFSEESKRNIESVVNRFNEEEHEIELSTDKLYYQKFTSMNDYYNVFSFSAPCR